MCNFFLFITEEQEARRKRESQTDTVESYEEAYKRICTIVGEDDMNILVDEFIKKEDRNFALFNYVNEQNDHKEALTEQIHEVCRKCVTF